MLTLARANAAYASINNVEFLQGAIEAILCPITLSMRSSPTA
jgi:hypothetical protein